MKIISLYSLRIVLTATRTGVQDQNQGRPRTTRMLCGRTG